MGLNLRLPNITGLSEREQILQIKSYLYQLVNDLQFAFNDTSSTSDSVVVTNKSGVSSASSQSISATTMFSVLKPLIIKSADIVDAYYEKLTTKFEGKYVAQSDFGTYTENTSQAIQENSTAIAQTFTNIQTIDTELSGKVSGIKQDVEATTKELSDSIRETQTSLSESINGVSENLSSQIEAIAVKLDAILTVNAYIKSGLLYYNSESLPVYGVEVGQTNNVNGADVFKKFARFTADRLSFYDQNDTEVAYISDYKLYITSVEILYNLIGGGFILDLSRGWTLKYAGGE